jgi:homoserine O-acetyltransferase/O-succinyltransferase
VALWEGFFLPKEPNNLLTMLWTWQNGDISDNELYGGDFKAALAAIKAKAYVTPGQTDLYFPPEDSELEVAHMPNAKFVTIPSLWGHFAGGPGTNPKDVDFIDAKLKSFLRRSAVAVGDSFAFRSVERGRNGRRSLNGRIRP